jgi:serine/threonine protein kinase/Flp pilus assembly protein TadD
MTVRCPECQTDNTDDSRYCRNCATPLPPASGRPSSPQDLASAPTLAMPPHQDELTPGTTFAGRYLVVELLGKGGMGKVYKVLDKEINEKISIKVIRPEISVSQETIERFQNEMKITRRITHKNVCRIYHLEKENGTYYITMEYVAGENLKRIVRMTKELSFESALEIGQQICEGLAEAHRLGIVHRDLKPQNIMIDEEGTVRIMDFGIASSIETKGITAPGMMIGTPEYMSPEQVEGTQVDQRSDIYSLGIILYEMVAGRPPFEGDTPLNLAYKHRHEPPPDPREFNPEIPEPLTRVILKCLEKEKEKRYQSAPELEAELKNIEEAHTLAETQMRAQLSTTRRRAVRFRLKRPALWAAAGVAVIALGLVLGKFILQKSPPPVPLEPFKVAVISFENKTGDKSYDYLQEAIPNLLITSLDQSRLMRITSWERLRDLMKQLGREDQKVIDSDLGFDLCRMDGVQAIVTGSFVKAGDVFVTDAKVLDVGTKTILNTVNSRGDGVDSILRKQIDDLSREIARGFSTEEQTTRASITPIMEATTKSLDAYNYFLRGREEYERFYWTEAKRFLEMAVELDSEFAMAYSYLVRVYASLGNADAARGALEKLKKYGTRVQGKEGLYIQALLALYDGTREKYFEILKTITREYPEEKRVRVDLASYYMQSQKYDEAIAELKRALELDPRYGFAMNLIAYSYGYQNNFDEAIKYFNLYASVSPGDANPYDSMGDLYFRMGRLKEAREKYAEAIRIRPDFGSGSRISYICALTGDYAGAMTWINQFIDAAPSSGFKTVGYQLKAIYHYLFGQVRLALEDLDKAREFSAAENDYGAIDQIYRAKIWICYDWGKYDLLLKYARERFDFRAEHKIRTDLFNSVLYSFYQGLADVKQGRLDRAVSRLAEINKARSEEKDENSLFWTNNAHEFLRAEINLSQGHWDEAVEAFKNMGPTELTIGLIYTLLQQNIPLINDLPARAYAGAGKIDKAISEYERLTSADPQERKQELLHPFSRFRLAKLYEQKGERDKALAQYERLAEIWKNADQDLAEVKEASQRLAALKKAR